MTPAVAIVAPGAMGAGIGKRLASHGVRVLTSLAGRSEATAARASEAGMVAASDEEIAAADFVLSILPPGDALALAQSRRSSPRAMPSRSMSIATPLIPRRSRRLPR
jgi:L-threonate 2-dehydrogenase